MSAIIYKRAETAEELNQILNLQRINLPTEISNEEKQSEGFVTVHHDYDILKAMNDKCPHIIAKHSDKVIGYTLCMDRSFKNDIEVLKSMFGQIEKKIEKTISYIIMGQVCIDKAYRKQGIFRGLYQQMKLVLKSQFDLIITQVDKSNIRSLNAHYAIGFKILYSYRSNEHDWEILFWRLN
ncbi:MAG: GNAT family N-acetyltransferase [Flavobacteriaceae bacterium]|nr:GNAT family N-acetyltransferase [Flavobacteriaceae bacterium]